MRFTIPDSLLVLYVIKLDWSGSGSHCIDKPEIRPHPCTIDDAPLAHGREAHPLPFDPSILANHIPITIVFILEDEPRTSH